MADNGLPEGWIEKPIQGTQESIDINNGTLEAQRLFYGPWADRYNFLSNFLPTITATSENASLATRFYYPDIPHLMAYKASVSGKLKPGNTGTNQQISYDTVEITVYYRADPTTFFLTSGTWGSDPENPPPGEAAYRTTYSWETVTELINFKGKNVKDKDGQKQHDKGDVEFPLKLMNIKITYHDSTYPNVNGSFGISGKINNDSIFFTDLGAVFSAFPAKTLRYDGSAGSMKIALRDIVEGVPDLTWEITHNLVYNPLRWDRIPIGIEPVEVGQANATPVNLIYQNVSKYLVDSINFASALRNITIS